MKKLQLWFSRIEAFVTYNSIRVSRQEAEVLPVNGLFIGICVMLLLLFSSDAMRAASEAASVFVHGVMPALFPMMILNCLAPPPADSGHAFGGGRAAAGTVLFSFAAGSPASAQRVRQMADGGSLSRGRLAFLLGATGVMSPMFFVGTLAGWTGLSTAAWAMLGAHWISALLAGMVVLLASKILPGKAFSGTDGAARAQGGSGAPSTQGEKHPAISMLSVSASISSSAQALLAVCGSMMLFSIVAGVLRAVLSSAFPAWTAGHAQQLAVLWALLEIGGGSSAVITAYGAPPLSLLCALCSFGGLSIWIQNLLFLGPCVRPAKLLTMRVLHGALSYGLCRLLFAFFPMLARTFAAADAPAFAAVWGLPPLIPALLIVLSVPALRQPRSPVS